MKSLMNILVTGGAGFVGSHLCKKLIADGHTIICVDNLQTGRRGNLDTLSHEERLRFVVHDVTQPFPELGAIDAIYNLACPASPPHYQKDPIATIMTSVLGTLHLLELAAAQKISILQASTSEVYGSPQVHPQPETYWGNVNPVGVRACYDEGKRCAESLCFDFHRTRGVPIKVARIFNTYGPFMDPADGRVISNCIVQALQNEPITIYGDGRQTRSFCYIDDMVEALIRLMQSPTDFTGPVNLGNDSEFTMIELAKRVLAITGSKSTIVFRPLPQDDPEHRRPDLRLAREKLGWTPSTGLEEGLRKTIDYFASTLGVHR